MAFYKQDGRWLVIDAEPRPLKESRTLRPQLCVGSISVPWMQYCKAYSYHFVPFPSSRCGWIARIGSISGYFLFVCDKQFIYCFFLFRLLYFSCSSYCLDNGSWRMPSVFQITYKLLGDNHIAANCLIVQLVICILIILPAICFFL